MKRLTLYIAFLFLALAQAQAQDSELTDMYATGKTRTTSFTNGAWYMIFTNSIATNYLREKSDHKGIEAISGSTTISFPTVGSLATDGNMPYMLFKAVGDDTNGYSLKSGKGNYIVVKVSGKNSNNVSASVSLSDNSGTPMAIGNSSEYVTIRTYSTSKIGWYYYYYGYLNTSGGATPNKDLSATNTSYQLYLYEVSLVEKHKVTYKYMYNGTLLDSVESAPLAIGDKYPTVTLPQALVDKNYELDPSDTLNWPKGTIGNFNTLEDTILVRPKATAKEQTLTVTSYTEAQTGQRLDLTTLVSSNATNPSFEFALTNDGGTGSTLDNQTLETGDKEGEVKMTVKGKEVGSSSDPENWYAASAEQTFTITVKSVPSYVSEFCKAYEKLAAYRGNIGKGLGMYTLKATEGGTTYDNEAYLSTLALYSPMYADPTGSSESALKDATAHVRTLTAVLESKDSEGNYRNLSLGMPEDGTLLRISSADVSGYLTPTDDDIPSLEAKSVGKSSTPSADNIFYYYATGEGGQCSLLSYRNGLFLSLSNTETQLTEDKDVIEFSAYSMAILDGRYAMAGVPDKAFLLEEVDVLPVTISQYEWATLYTPVALTIPGNLHAYVETSDAPIGGKIPVKRIIGTVPPRTALILNGPQGEYSFKVAHRLSTESGPNKFLTGTFPLVSTSTLGTNVMTLQPKADAAGFYKWTKPIVTHFKVYHTTAASSESKGYALSFDTEDSIGGIGGEEAIQAIYTLQGNALRHYPTRGGLYIVNGKKVLIR